MRHRVRETEGWQDVLEQKRRPIIEMDRNRERERDKPRERAVYMLLSARPA